MEINAYTVVEKNIKGKAKAPGIVPGPQGSVFEPPVSLVANYNRY